jgi:hypothetical protein
MFVLSIEVIIVSGCIGALLCCLKDPPLDN